MLSNFLKPSPAGTFLIYVLETCLEVVTNSRELHIVTHLRLCDWHSVRAASVASRLVERLEGDPEHHGGNIRALHPFCVAQLAAAVEPMEALPPLPKG
jgi:hypothetical protein